jgi:DNA-binding winged helix-turn-helix (wHTH) protein/tetratricopeptide (TPR) repeat protein
MPSQPPERYCFDAFEFVTSTGYLYRKGHPVRLSEQQGRLLLALLERAGEVVSPQQIRGLLWPNGEHLDHNHAIRNAINQLRAILRDKPQAARFIETLPKRGYRFIAPVSDLSQSSHDEIDAVVPEPLAGFTRMPIFESAPLALLDASRDPGASLCTALVTEQAIEFSAPEADPPLSPDRRNRWKTRLTIAAILLVVLGVAATFTVLHFRLVAKQPARETVVITLGIAPIDAEGAAAQQVAEPFRMELMDSISQLPGVEVRATHSFPSDQAGMSNPHAVAQRLQLDALLLGRIESVDADHFDFVFELVRGSDAVHLASLHYSGTAGQIAATRDRIQRDLFYRLSNVSDQRLKPLHSTENTAAYSAYLSGRAELIRHDDAAVTRAITDLQRAIELDPNFAQAYAGLGSAYLLLAEHGATDREANYARSRQAALTATRLNLNLGEAHATLGFLDFRHDWNPAASEAEFRRAIELDPNQAMHRIMYSLLLSNMGRGGEALEQINRAHDADPLWPPIYVTEMYVASAAGKNSIALEAARKLLEFMPDWPLAHDQSAWAFWYAGRYEDAVKEWIQMAHIEHDSRRLSLEQEGLILLRRQGVTAYSRHKLYAIEHAGNSPWNHPNDFQLAEWEINAGQFDAALDSIRQMVRDHDPEALQFAASPAYLRLHNNRDFRALLGQIGLPQP